jgi:CTP:molybdopterin cytidylyltransferase MocA
MTGEPVDAVILAGGVNRIPLFPGHEPGPKALVPLCGQSLLRYVLDAAREATTLRRIFVVGSPEVCAAAQRDAECDAVVSEQSLLADLRAGAAAVRTPKALFMTGDLPLLRGPMIDEFMERAVGTEADLTASVVERSRLGPYAGTHKVFIRLADGSYQHGNLAMIPPASLLAGRAWQRLDDIYEARKNGLRTAAVLGPKVLFWFAIDVLLLHRPTLQRAVDFLSRAAGGRIAAVVSSYPEIMLDIDEPEDYQLAEQALCAKAQERPAPAPQAA